MSNVIVVDFKNINCSSCITTTTASWRSNTIKKAFVRCVLDAARKQFMQRNIPLQIAALPAAIIKQQQLNRIITTLQTQGWTYRGGIAEKDILISHPLHTKSQAIALSKIWYFQPGGQHDL